MKKLTTAVLAVAAICALAAPAGASAAAKTVKYEVTMHFRVITKKFRNGTVKGSLRWQYEFLIPKYPIGTFSIYSCLGEATFRAKPQ